MMTRTIGVAVVEDDAYLRRSFERVITAAEGCRLVGVCATVAEAVRRIPSLAPDVILMDVNLPDGSGVDCVAELSGRLPDTQILMVTAYQDPDTAFRAITAGAHGYLVKPVTAQKLVEAIREIREGGVPMSRAVARKVIAAFRRMNEKTTLPTRQSAAATGHSPQQTTTDSMLAPREQQVLEFLVEGYSYKEIAGQLGLSTGTVSTYVNRIYKKLHVSSRREVVAWSKGGGDPKQPGRP
jgi:DNA-binding NarL/FixJ family response regulator